VGFALAVVLVVGAVIEQEAAAAQARKRRDLIRPHSRTIPQDVKIAVSVRDGGKCRICRSTKDLQYDHIIPWSKGGPSDDPNNIQLLCGYHNRLKRDR